jgi:hypothetical protein
LLNEDAATEFLLRIVEKARKKGLTSDAHFSVDGTLIEAWASMKSFRPKDEPKNPDDDQSPKGRNEARDFHGEKLSNDTHESKTDPQARLFKKSQGASARLSFMGHALMENRSGLIMATRFTQATGTAEREAALDMLKSMQRSGPFTLGADKGYDDRKFVTALRKMKGTPHVARKSGSKNIDGRTSRQPGYAISLKVRKRIEECFGWIKQSACFRKTKLRGLARNAGMFNIMAAAFNLVRISSLVTE